ncbi:MAG: FliH/SctL family protein [Rhizobacter sp.]
MRDLRVSGEPVLLRSGSLPPTAPLRPPAAVKPLARAATPSAPAPMSSGPRIGMPPAPAAASAEPAVAAGTTAATVPAFDPAAREREFRSALEAERTKVLEDARAAGHTAGVEAGRAEWQERIAELDRAIGAVRNGFETGIAGAEDVIVEIAFEAIAKILGTAAPTREGVLGIVRETLAAVREREGLVLRLAPGDVAVVEAARPQLQKGAKLPTLQIVADDRVELGGCLVETAGGGLDGRLETQLGRLRDAQLAARGAGEGGA